jgi:hypothetical protein
VRKLLVARNLKSPVSVSICAEPFLFFYLGRFAASTDLPDCRRVPFRPRSTSFFFQNAFALFPAIELPSVKAFVVSGIMCTICRAPERVEINGALESGELSQREIAIRFGVNRSSLQRHCRNCLKISYDVSAEEKKRAEIRRSRMDGRLEDALGLARRAQEKAIEDGDQVGAWRMAKEVSKILRLLDRATKKASPVGTITVGGQKRKGYGAMRWAESVEWPPDAARDLPELVAMFSTCRKSERQRAIEAALPPNAPVLRFKIEWQNAAVFDTALFKNPVLKDPTDPLRGYIEGPEVSLEQLAQAQSPDALAAVTAEVPEVEADE